jgi:hypothetical protein
MAAEGFNAEVHALPELRAQSKAEITEAFRNRALIRMPPIGEIEAPACSAHHVAGKDAARVIPILCADLSASALRTTLPLATGYPRRRIQNQAIPKTSSMPASAGVARRDATRASAQPIAASTAACAAAAPSSTNAA